jgi:hypothetical protein
MRNPQHNDVYINSEGFKVVVNNIFLPNPAGVRVLEFKFIGLPELHFMPVQDFVEQYQFVETFSSYDVNMEERIKLRKIKEDEAAKAALLRKKARDEAVSATKR